MFGFLRSRLASLASKSSWFAALTRGAWQRRHQSPVGHRVERLEDRTLLSTVAAAGPMIFQAFPGEPNDVTITPGVLTHVTDNPNISLLGVTPCLSVEWLRGLSFGFEVGFIASASVSFPLIPFDLPDGGVYCVSGGGFASLFTTAAQTASTPGSSVVAGKPLTQGGDAYFKVTGNGDTEISNYQLYQVIADPASTHPDALGGDLDADATVFRAASPGVGRMVTGNVADNETDAFSFDAAAGKRYVVMLDQDPEGDGVITSTNLRVSTISGLILRTPLAVNNSVDQGNAIGAFSVGSNQKLVIEVSNLGVGMSSSYRFVVVEYGTSVAELEGAVSVPATDPALPLAIADVAAVSSTLSVSGFGTTLTDVNVTLDIDHTFDADLDVFLRSPSGTLVELFTDVGGGGDNFDNTTLDDEFSFNPISSGSASFSSTFGPEGTLSSFDGEDPNGIWTLEITDDAGGDIGTLNSWSLKLTTAGNTDTPANARTLEGAQFGDGP